MNQNNNLINRQEFKYFVTEENLIPLRQSLRQFMKIDENANKSSNTYKITSLYFDTPLEEDFEDKVDGIKSREKFRIRTYNNNLDLIKFESKKRVETVIKKTSAIISKEDSICLCEADFSCLKEKNNNFLNLSYSILKSGGYRPTVVIEYDREAYYLPYGNIRITFDLNLRTYNSDTNFNSLKTSTMPIFQNGLQILEVKHSIPLPSHIKMILGKTIATRNAISKFILGQRYNEKGAYRDPIHEPF